MNTRPVRVVILTTIAACAAMFIAWPATYPPERHEAAPRPRHYDGGDAATGRGILNRILYERGGWGGIGVTGQKAGAPLYTLVLSPPEWDALTYEQKAHLEALLIAESRGAGWRLMRAGAVMSEGIGLSGLLKY